MNADAKPSCATCWLYEPAPSECRAEPPRPTGPAPTGRQAAWPVVPATAYCGRHPELQARLAEHLAAAGAVTGTVLTTEHVAPAFDTQAIAAVVLERVAEQLPALVLKHAQSHSQPRSGGGGGGRRG